MVFKKKNQKKREERRRRNDDESRSRRYISIWIIFEGMLPLNVRVLCKH
jgi:hypothetical protein